MKLLLTSAGITNSSIKNSLAGLMSKPFNESKLVFIPTAANIEKSDKSWVIEDLDNCKKLNFKEIDILNIDAIPQEKIWRPRIESGDVLFFGGGNSFYLMHWLKNSGLLEALPELLKNRVYVGISAGSIITAPNLSLSTSRRRDLFEMYFEEEIKGDDIEKGLNFVNFHIRPHLNSPHFPLVTVEHLSETAKEIKELMYAIDDESAVEVIDGQIKIVSEGVCKIFNA